MDKYTKDLGIDVEPGEGVALREEDQVRIPEAVAQEPEVEQEAAPEVAEDAPEEVPEIDEESQPEVAGKLSAKEFASQAGWSLEEFYRDVVVPTEEGEVPLSQVVDGYKALQTEIETLQQERQELQARQPQAVPSGQYSPEAQALWNQADYLAQQYQQTNWSTVEDAANLRLEYQDNIRTLREGAQAKQAEFMQGQQKAFEEYRVSAEKEIQKAIPAWKNPRVASEEKTAASTWMASEYGLSDQDAERIWLHPPSAKLVRDAFNFAKEREQIKQGAKKIQRVPKHLSPSARKDAAKAKLEDIGKNISKVTGRKARQQARLNAEWN